MTGYKVVILKELEVYTAKYVQGEQQEAHLLGQAKSFGYEVLYKADVETNDNLELNEFLKEANKKGVLDLGKLEDILE